MNVSVSEITNAVLMLLDENRALLETRLTYCDPGASRERGGRTRRYQRRSSA